MKLSPSPGGGGPITPSIPCPICVLLQPMYVMRWSMKNTATVRGTTNPAMVPAMKSLYYTEESASM